MLSNPISNPPPSALQARQRLHRRQRSTPAAFDSTKMPCRRLSKSHIAATAAFSAVAQPLSLSQQPRQQPPARQAIHRRGLSLDTRRQQLQNRHQRHQETQEQQQQIMATAVVAPNGTYRNGNLLQELNDMVGSGASTNTGSPTIQQHAMQETQQQRPVRPGNTPSYDNKPFTRQSHEEALFLLAQRQQNQQKQQQQLQQNCDAASFKYYNGPTAVMMRKSFSGGGQPIGQQDFQLFVASGQQDFQTDNAYMSVPDASNASAIITTGAASPGWVSEEETSSTRRGPRRVSNGIMDRVSKFESLATDSLPRVATPPYQNNAYFPPTPTETPQARMAKLERSAQFNRFSDDYDESMEETIKAHRNRGNYSNRSSSIFDDMRQQAEAVTIMTTPQRSNVMQMPKTPADFMNMSNLSTDFLKLQNTDFSASSVTVPTDMQHMSPPLSQNVTPTTTQGVFEGSVIDANPMSARLGLLDDKVDLWATDYDTQPIIAPGEPVYNQPSPLDETQEPSRRRIGHKRNESLASVVSAASIASINIEETRTETGVTIDDIATYIEGPNLVDGKWRCTYEGCDKRFGRKENIKSHVQTHLNDRQYQCPHCHKCFVRQHDLKRHAKIHTGVKPYPCECGNNFARHDALTRHRQRGMCIGAFDGAVRKVGKRGRPRKVRPGMESRLEKSSRTRSRNRSSASSRSAHASSPGTSLHSSVSDSSAANSPRSEGSSFDHEPFNSLDADLLDMSFGASMNATSSSGIVSNDTMNPNALAVSSAPMPGTGFSAAKMVKPMPAVLPSEHATEVAASPSASSHLSPASHASHPDLGTDIKSNEENDDEYALPGNHPTSPTKSVASHYTQHPATPPELSSSSSPLQPSSHLFFEMDPNSSFAEEDSIGLSAPLTSQCGSLGGMEVGGLSASSLDEDIMLMKALTTDDVLVQLDNSGLSMLNTSKFDEEYAMFTNNDDVFFGN